MSRVVLSFLVTVLIHVVFTQDIELVNMWKYLDFNFRTQAEKKIYIENEHYKNCTIAGVKVDSNGNIYVSIPRWRANVPITLAKVNNNTKILEAFPSWEMNNVTDGMNALQSVLGFEIDSKDRMWILDQGRIDNVPGVAKIIIWDLKKGELIQKFVFNETIAPPSTVFLNDIVVNTEDNLAFISDSGIPVVDGTKPKPAIIMFDLDDNSAKRHLESVPSTELDSNVWLNVNGKKCFKDKPMQTGVDGIALSCDFQRLYWTPLTSRRLYGIETDILLMYDSGDAIVNASVVDLGNKKSSSDGFISSSKRELFLTALETNAIYLVNERQITQNVQNVISPPELSLTTVSNDSRLLWPDTMSISIDGYLYVTSNNLCAFLQGELNFNQNNFFIYRIKLESGAISYVNGCDSIPTNFGPIEIALMSSGAALFVASIVIVLIISARKQKHSGTYDEL